MAGGRGEAGARADTLNGDGGTAVDSALPEDAGGSGTSLCTPPGAGTLVLPVALVSGRLDGPNQNPTTSCGVDGARGPQAVYLLDVPERTALTLTVKASVRFILAVRKVCDDASTEVACKIGEPAPSSASLRAMLDPGTYWVVIHLVDESTSSGDYTLSLASNGTCGNAGEILENAAGFGNAATAFGDLAGGEPSALPFACSNTGQLGNTLHYHAQLPAGGTLVAKARRSDLGEPLPINIVDTCASTVCLADAIGQVRYSNVGTTATDVIIKVGSGSVSGSLPFELQVAILPLAANAICTSPDTIAAGTPVEGDTSFGSTTPLPCMDHSVGALYYSITIPVGMSLSAEVTPVDPFDAELVIFDTCGADSCASTAQEGPGQKIAELANTSSSPRPVIVAVSAPTNVGRFTLNATLR